MEFDFKKEKKIDKHVLAKRKTWLKGNNSLYNKNC